MSFGRRVIPRHIKILLLLLPLFIARSMVPIGFMLAFDEGTPRIVFCPSQLTLPGEPVSADEHVEHSAHHAHQQSSEQSDADRAELSHQTCPFAFAAAAPLSAANLFEPEPAASEVIARPHQLALPSVAARAHLIRGPPALS